MHQTATLNIVATDQVVPLYLAESTPLEVEAGGVYSVLEPSHNLDQGIVLRAAEMGAPGSGLTVRCS